MIQTSIVLMSKSNKGRAYILHRARVQHRRLGRILCGTIRVGVALCQVIRIVWLDRSSAASQCAAGASIDEPTAEKRAHCAARPDTDCHASSPTANSSSAEATATAAAACSA